MRGPSTLPASLWGLTQRIKGPLDPALEAGVGPRPLVDRRMGGSRACSTEYVPDLMRTPQIWTELSHTNCSHVDTSAFSHEYNILFYFLEPGRIRMLSQFMSSPLREPRISLAVTAVGTRCHPHRRMPSTAVPHPVAPRTVLR